jgi:K+-transporting ATPase A subunit
MNGLHWLQLAGFLPALVVSTPLLRGYVAGVFGRERMMLTRWLGPANRWLCRIVGCELTREMDCPGSSLEISRAALW